MQLAHTEDNLLNIKRSSIASEYGKSCQVQELPCFDHQCTNPLMKVPFYAHLSLLKPDESIHSMLGNFLIFFIRLEVDMMVELRFFFEEWNHSRQQSDC